MRSVDQGLRVAPQVADSVNGQRASSGSRVVPMMTAPAARSRRTTSASRGADGSGEPVPIDAECPSTATLSLTAMGMPSSGRPSRIASADSASARAVSRKTACKALSRPS